MDKDWRNIPWLNLIGSGVVRKNPVFVLTLGLCPAVAVTHQVNYALALGLAVMILLPLSSAAAVVLRDVLSREVLFPLYLFITAGLTAMTVLIFQVRWPLLTENLGIFLPLTAVNCVILGRGQPLLPGTRPQQVLADGLGTGLGFSLALGLIALVREVLGSGRITLFPVGGFDGILLIPGLHEAPLRIFTAGAGGFLVLGYLTALIRAAVRRRESRRQGRREASL